MSYWRGFDTAYRLALEGHTGFPDMFGDDRKTTAYLEGYHAGANAATWARLTREIERAEKEERLK